jgi:hypothetical protein
MKGVALFKVIKELRENTERLNDVRIAFREDAQEDEELIQSTLSATSSNSLICEVLPMLSKCLPGSVSTRAKELVHLPWNAVRGEEAAQFDSEGEEVSASYLEETRPLQEGTVQIDKSFSPTKKARPATKKKSAPLLIDEDDDIEEF